MYKRRSAANRKLPGHRNGSTSICKCKIRHCLTAVKRMRRCKGLLWTGELHKLIKRVKILKGYHTFFLPVLFSSLERNFYSSTYKLQNYECVCPWWQVLYLWFNIVPCCLDYKLQTDPYTMQKQWRSWYSIAVTHLLGGQWSYCFQWRH